MRTLPEPVALQFWSHSPITDEIRALIETILKGDEPCPPNAELAGTGTVWEPSARIHQTKEGLWVLNDDSHISKWVEERGSLYHDHQTLPVVLPEIQPGDWVVDAGANIGDSTIPFADRVGPTGKVYAFEPYMDAFECLRLNSQNRPQVIADNVGLGETHAGLTLRVQGNAGASFIETGNISDLKCMIIPLDSLELTACDFIKIDVEGYEANVLRGAEQTINRFHPKLLIEINKGALARQNTSEQAIKVWLLDHGYGFKPVQPDVHADSPQFDLLCTWEQKVQTDNHATTTLRADLPPQTPWENREQSTEEIRAIAGRLKAFMGNSVYTRRVRDVLHETGVIQLPYRFKKRKGKWKRKAKT